MIISIQSDLKNIKDELETRGYEIYDFSEGRPSDIYIYAQHSSGLSNIYNNISPTEGGSFLLNIDNMTMEQIIKCIENRTYTPIF